LLDGLGIDDGTAPFSRSAGPPGRGRPTAIVPAMTAPRDPEQLEAAGVLAPAQIAPQTMVGPVRLTVSDLARSVGYYRSAIGLRLLSEDATRASLGVSDRELLALEGLAGARPARGSTGLYHFALLVPERAALARWLAHAVREHVTLTGTADHFVSEAIYLSDPDGHGIELYWDRPRASWEGQVAARMTTLALDVDGLLSELAQPASEPFDELDSDTVMGHVHLKVSSISSTVAFYRDGLGMALMATLGSQAAFFSAGGYHHHIGANSWESAGGAPPAPGSAALAYATISLPDAAERERVLERVRIAGHDAVEHPAGPVVHDPSGNALLLALAE
jgi:catechol 2,3-dioxygenase